MITCTSTKHFNLVGKRSQVPTRNEIPTLKASNVLKILMSSLRPHKNCEGAELPYINIYW